jgi:hypothetical protein
LDPDLERVLTEVVGRAPDQERHEFYEGLLRSTVEAYTLVSTWDEFLAGEQIPFVHDSGVNQV